MNGTAAIAQQGNERLGVMVRSGTSIHVYWEATGRTALGLTVADLSGRPRGELLDGVGLRVVPLSTETGSLYIEELLPGHIYQVELGEITDRGFSLVLSSRPIETPWPVTTDRSDFPKPYHRS